MKHQYNMIARKWRQTWYFPDNKRGGLKKEEGSLNKVAFEPSKTHNHKALGTSLSNLEVWKGAFNTPN